MRPGVRRAALALVLGLLAAALTLTARPAMAADHDTIDSYAIDYRLEASGVLHVTETIVYRFSSSEAHGIERVLVTREPYDDQSDQVFGLTNITVHSPSGAAAEFTTSTTSADHGRARREVLRIGDPDETVTEPTATYVIGYDVTGALRSTGGTPEFYWDATGFDWEADIAEVSVTATVPGGVQDLRCYAGPVGSRTECPTRTVRDGVAKVRATGLPVGNGLTIAVQLAPGVVADPQPRLERNAAELNPVVRTVALAGVGVGGLLSLAVPLLAFRWWRRNGRDQRYLGLPPGTRPVGDSPVRIGYDDRSVPVPVSFSPPKIPVAEAGLLVDGTPDAEQTAATLVDLAVRGAITLRRGKGGKVSAEWEGRHDGELAQHESDLLGELFADGHVRKLSGPGSLTSAAAAMERALAAQLTAHQWLRPRVPLKPIVVVGAVATVVTTVALIPFGLIALLGLVPVLGAGAFAVVQLFRDNGVAPRTAEGRAMADQVEGFRTYLSTAEADQLRFEEGEDIFSKYLPWAIVFDVADRWERICADLVASGRLSAEPPPWWDGPGRSAAFQSGAFTDTVSSARTDVSNFSTGASTGTGSGAGSAFSGGGGSAGGGGGGGGGGSW